MGQFIPWCILSNFVPTQAIVIQHIRANYEGQAVEQDRVPQRAFCSKTVERNSPERCHVSRVTQQHLQ